MASFLKRAFGSAVALCAAAGISWGQSLPASPSDEVQALRAQLQQQQQQIDALSRRINPPSGVTLAVQQPAPPAKAPPPVGGSEQAPPNPPGVVSPGSKGAAAAPAGDGKTMPSLFGDYLRDNPGAGMPPGVQTGYSMGTGFFIRSAPDPTFGNWNDQSAIPFEMRFRGRMQLNYDYYKVQDTFNHLTQMQGFAGAGVGGSGNAGDFSQLEAKRVRLLWEGTVFTPNLSYEIQLDANTRGFASYANNKVAQGGPGANTPAAGGFGAPGTSGNNSPIGGNIATDHAARLFTAWFAYQIPLGSRSNDCIECPVGTYSYTPSLTFIVGKQQPYFSLIEILGSATSQFAEFHMANWFFDSDGNNMLMAASAQYKDFDDRLLVMAQMTNGSDFGTPNPLGQKLPGFIGCFWYDFGGEFDNERKRWNLYGNSVSDLNYSRNLTVRVGGAANIVGLDSRATYGDIPSSVYFTAPGGPNGTRFINLFGGLNGAGTPGQHNLDRMNVFTYDAFLAAHWRGFSFYNEWYMRNYSSLHTRGDGLNQIVYQDGLGMNSLYPVGHSMLDFGTAVQAGYFIIPKKLEVMALYSMVDGVSGNIMGNGTFTNTTVVGSNGPVRVYDRAFRNYRIAQEAGVGFNYYWFGQLVKWTTDINFYSGGNPSGNGTGAAGFIPGVDGWLLQSQIQIAF